MQKLGVGALLHEVDLAWESLGELHKTAHGHLRITFPDDVVARTQYWDAVNLLGGVPIVDHPAPVHGAAVRERPRDMENLHTYADGDFFVAPKAAIDSLRGYPEIPLPILIDSLLTVQVCLVVNSMALGVVFWRCACIHVHLLMRWKELTFCIVCFLFPGECSWSSPEDLHAPRLHFPPISRARGNARAGCSNRWAEGDRHLYRKRHKDAGRGEAHGVQWW
jgi:hypothetical protein